MEQQPWGIAMPAVATAVAVAVGAASRLAARHWPGKAEADDYEHSYHDVKEVDLPFHASSETAVHAAAQAATLVPDSKKAAPGAIGAFTLDASVADRSAAEVSGHEESPPSVSVSPPPAVRHEESVFEVDLERSEGEAWGFAWNVGAHAALRLIIAGVSPSSPAGRWSSERRAQGLPAIERGDELISTNGSTEHGAIRSELACVLVARLRFLPASVVPPIDAGAGGSPPGGRVAGGARLAMARRRLAVPQASPFQSQLPTPPPSPGASPGPCTPDNAMGPHSPASGGSKPSTPVHMDSESSAPGQDSRSKPVGCLVKNTFIEVRDDNDEVHEDRVIRSDPSPIKHAAALLGPGGLNRLSPYQPGCLAGVDLAVASIVAESGGQDSSGTWASAKSLSGSGGTGTGSEGQRTNSSFGAPLVDDGQRTNLNPGQQTFPEYSLAAMAATTVATGQDTWVWPPQDPPGISTEYKSSSSQPCSDARAAAPLSTGFSAVDPVLLRPSPVGSGSFAPSSTAYLEAANVNSYVIAAAVTPQVPAESGVGNQIVAASLTKATPALHGQQQHLQQQQQQQQQQQRHDLQSQLLHSHQQEPPQQAQLLSPPKSTHVEPCSTATVAPFASSPSTVVTAAQGKTAEVKSGVGQGESDAEGTESGDSAGAPSAVRTRKPTRRGGRRARHRKLAAQARMAAQQGADVEAIAAHLASDSATAASSTGPSGVVSTLGLPAGTPAVREATAVHSAGAAGPTTSVSAAVVADSASAGASATGSKQEPVRRGGRPPKKSVLAARASAVGGDSSVAPVEPVAAPASSAGVAAQRQQMHFGNDRCPQPGHELAPPVADVTAGVCDDDVIGRRVLITGLVRAPHFNGQWGRVEAYDSEMKRYVVMVLSGSEVEAASKAGLPPVMAKLRRENFIVPPPVSLRLSDEFGGSGIPAEPPPKVMAPTGVPPPPIPATRANLWPSEPAFVPYPQPPLQDLGSSVSRPPLGPPLGAPIMVPEGQAPGLTPAASSFVDVGTGIALGGDVVPSPPRRIAPSPLSLSELVAEPAQTLPGPAADFEDSIGNSHNAMFPTGLSACLPAGLLSGVAQADVPICGPGPAADFEDSVGGALLGANSALRASPTGAGTSTEFRASVQGFLARAPACLSSGADFEDSFCFLPASASATPVGGSVGVVGSRRISVASDIGMGSASGQTWERGVPDETMEREDGVDEEDQDGEASRAPPSTPPPQPTATPVWRPSLRQI